MESRNAFARTSFRIAFAISLVLHAALLSYGFLVPANVIPPEPKPEEAEPPRMNAMLLKPPTPQQVPQPPEPPPVERREILPPRQPPPKAPMAPQPPKAPQPTAPKILTAPRSAPVWNQNERQEMAKFLEEVGKQDAKQPPKPVRPTTGRDLAQQALIIAAQIARQPTDDADERELPTTKPGSKPVEPLSIEMYIAAFVQKLNRGANFVSRAPRVRGLHVGQVQITLSADGSLKSYRVLRQGDQQAEINYIKSVIDVAAPFAAFPPDVRDAMDTLSIPVCISPRFSAQGGKVFARTGSKECQT